MRKKMVITIDGPAGAGKSTISRIVAKKLGYIYLDTGSLYRALAYKALRDAIVLDNPDGRDMGSVVFPSADYKFFLDADIEERIKRRHRELLNKGNSSEVPSIRKDMLARDKQDSKREIAPLKPTSSSIIIDSTKLSIPEVVENIIRQVSKNNSW
jgi:cytidylate kinase